MLSSSLRACSPEGLLPPVRRGRRASGLRSFADLLHDLLRLVVPKELRAPVLKQHVEGQVLGVAPPCADRARKPSPLGAAMPGVGHHHPRADLRFFGPHKELVPPDTLLASPYGSAPRMPHAEAVPYEDYGLLFMSRRCPPFSGRS